MRPSLLGVRAGRGATVQHLWNDLNAVVAFCRFAASVKALVSEKRLVKPLDAEPLFADLMVQVADLRRRERVRPAR